MKRKRFYFPKKKNLIPLKQDHLDAITKSLLLLGNLPHFIYYDPKIVEFYTDNTLQGSDILGYTTFLYPNRVILNPLVADSLLWKSSSGIPNNEISMSIVVHELTHLHQFLSWKWYGWMISHLLFLDKYMTKKWAKENEMATQRILSNHYKSLRKDYVFSRNVKLL